LNKEANKIDLEDRIARSVHFSDGTSISADYVIITADPATAFKQLLSAPLPKKLDEKYKDTRQKRFSSYQVAFVCDVDPLPFNGDLIFNTPHRLRSTLKTDRLILREYSHEKSFAPEGCCVLQSLTFCSEEDALDFIKLRRSDKIRYSEKKRLLSEAIKEAITDRFPHLKGHLACIDVWTPATYKRFTSSEIGSYMSFILPSKALPIKLGCRIKGVDNLLLATQWQQSPGGLPIAAECGKNAAKTAHLLSQKHNASEKLSSNTAHRHVFLNKSSADKQKKSL
jgi:phytoene dehydrogenase-like protein